MASSTASLEDVLDFLRVQRAVLQELPERIVERLSPVIAPQAPAFDGAAAEAPNTPAAACDPAIGDAYAGLADVQIETEKAQQHLDQISAEIHAKQQRLLELGAEIAAAEKTRDEAGVLLVGLQERTVLVRGDLEQAEAALASTRAQHEEAERIVDEARKIIAEAEPVLARKAEAEAKLAELSAKEAEYRGYRENHEAAQRLLMRIWPDWLREGPLATWREQLESAIFEADGPASAALLLAALHGYRGAFREAGDLGVLRDALREVSRRLFQWLKDLGKTEDEAAEIAQEWAVAINHECEGKAEVEVPAPGDPADSNWMAFRPGVSPTPVVVSVQTWCVRDSQKRPLNKAQITA